MKEKRVIIMNGYPGSGKTTISKILAEKFPTKIHSSIDYVKLMSKKWFGWDGTKTEENRLFLSNMKAFLNAETNLIENDLITAYEQFMESDNVLLIIDIREISEIKKYNKMFPESVTVFVENKNANKVTSNSSDADVMNFDYDIIIDNSLSLVDIYDSIDKFVEELYNPIKIGQAYIETWGQRIYVGEIHDLSEVFDMSKDWCARHNFDSYYIRQWCNEEDEIVMDFGSHSTFFIVTDHKGLLD